MESQTLINIAFTAVGGLMGLILKAVWDGLKELRAADASLVDKVQKIEVLVAGSYVTWEGFNLTLRPITETLQRIEDKLDKKADK